MSVVPLPNKFQAWFNMRNIDKVLERLHWSITPLLLEIREFTPEGRHAALRSIYNMERKDQMKHAQATLKASLAKLKLRNEARKTDSLQGRGASTEAV